MVMMTFQFSYFGCCSCDIWERWPSSFPTAFLPWHHEGKCNPYLEIWQGNYFFLCLASWGGGHPFCTRASCTQLPYQSYESYQWSNDLILILYKEIRQSVISTPPIAWLYLLMISGQEISILWLTFLSYLDTFTTGCVLAKVDTRWTILLSYHLT